MKRVIVASTSKPSENFAVIRMCLNRKSAARHLHRSVSNEMLKLKFNNVSNLEALQIALALSYLNDSDEICDYSEDLSQEELQDLVAVSGVSSEREAISRLNGQDVGSGEPITFTVRNDNKLIYSSGIKESYFGKMPSFYCNAHEESPAPQEEQSEFIQKVERYCNRKGLHHTDIIFTDKTQYSGYDGRVEGGDIYKIVPSSDGRNVALMLASCQGDYCFDHSDQFRTNLDDIYESVVRRASKSLRQYSDVSELDLVDPNTLHNVSVFLVESADDVPDADFKIWSLARKTNLAKAKSQNLALVAMSV